MDYIIEMFKNSFNFEGRTTRPEFWYPILFSTILSLLITLIDELVGTMGILNMIFLIVISIPLMALSVRRLHDIGMSGWWYLIGMIPILGLIMIYFYAKKSEDTDNDYGKYEA